MKPLLPALLFCCLWAIRPALALDLTPHFITRTVKGQPEHIPTFHEGQTQYTVTLPSGVMAASGSPGETVFYFRDLPEASFVMKASPFTPNIPFLSPTLESYRKQALESSPARATEVVLQEETHNPLPFSDWSSHRYTIAYKLLGKSFLQSVTFLNLSPDHQILLVIAAPPAEFERAAALSWNILRSWRTVAPGEDLSVPPPL